jgi:hypothetical protein
MDWTKVKSAIGTIAPWLAGTFGSPVAGVAVKALCDTFGLAGDSAAPEGVSAALANATPEQLLTLKLADQKHAEFMQSLGYTHLEKLEQLTVEDRSNARNREVATKDNTSKVLAAFAVVSFLVLVIYTAYGQAPAQGMHDVFLVVIGAAIATYKDVYGYYFGSSHGSQAKDETIAAQAGIMK